MGIEHANGYFYLLIGFVRVHYCMKVMSLSQLYLEVASL